MTSEASPTPSLSTFPFVWSLEAACPQWKWGGASLRSGVGNVEGSFRGVQGAACPAVLSAGPVPRAAGCKEPLVLEPETAVQVGRLRSCAKSQRAGLRRVAWGVGEGPHVSGASSRSALPSPPAPVPWPHQLDGSENVAGVGSACARGQRGRRPCHTAPHSRHPVWHGELTLGKDANTAMY